MQIKKRTRYKAPALVIMLLLLIGCGSMLAVPSTAKAATTYSLTYSGGTFSFVVSSFSAGQAVAVYAEGKITDPMNYTLAPDAEQGTMSLGSPSTRPMDFTFELNEKKLYSVWVRVEKSSGPVFSNIVYVGPESLERYQIAVAFTDAVYNDKTIAFTDVTLNMGHGTVNLSPTENSRYRYQTYYMYVWDVEIDAAKIAAGARYTLNGHFTVDGAAADKDIDACEFPVFIQSYRAVEMPETPAKQHYNFGGWYLDTDCTVPYDGGPIFADVTLHAKWIPVNYTVTFNSAGGETIPEVSVEYSTVISENALITPWRTGYTFLGWFLDDGTKYEDQLVTGPTTLIAHWDPIIYTVTFKVDNAVYATLEVPFGTSLVQAMQENGLAYFKVKSVAAADGSVVDDFTRVTGEMAVEITEKNFWEKAWTFIKNHWQWFVVGLDVVLVVCVGGGMIHKRKKKG